MPIKYLVADYCLRFAKDNKTVRVPVKSVSFTSLNKENRNDWIIVAVTNPNEFKLPWWLPISTLILISWLILCLLNLILFLYLLLQSFDIFGAIVLLVFLLIQSVLWVKTRKVLNRYLFKTGSHLKGWELINDDIGLI